MSISTCKSKLFSSQAEDGIRDHCVTGVQTCALPISPAISLVSPLPLNRITSNLVSTESPYQGESSDVGYEIWGRVSIEDVGDYRNSTLRIKFKIFLASTLGPLSSDHFPLLD